jgi:CheY-like chemotaxis protein
MNQVKKILVADDENLILYSLSSILHSDQTEVETVKNGTEALREIGTHFYDLAFSISIFPTSTAWMS